MTATDTIPFTAPGTDRRLRAGSVQSSEGGITREGALIDPENGRQFSIRDFVPRFVAAESYADSFGEQWNIFRQTQIDSQNATSLSEERLFKETRWPRDLTGQRVLEVGCGAGRFTQVLLDAGAEVYSVDFSSAVDACWGNCGPHPRLHLAQADIYELPFPPGSFDKVLCYGVLQHTPDVERAFFRLIPMLRPGGELAVDFYLKRWRLSRWNSKYLYRWFTRRMSRDRLRRIIEWYVPRWIPIDNQLQKIPGLGVLSATLIPCWNYTGILRLSNQQIREWAILDTFDALSPAHDHPQSLRTVRAWMARAGLEEISVRIGGTGIAANGRKPGPAR